jgi:chaperone required for assembly of F1-ATPase
MTDTRDWFPQNDEPNPMRAAQAGMRAPLPKRFYENAATQERDGLFVLTLDGRPARTPGRNLLAVPSRSLGDALAGEWQAQAVEINPAVMPLTRIVNSAIDGVASRREEVVDDLARYAGSDLLVYRAGHPERLVTAQAEAWDPVLDWIYDTYGARFILGKGVMHVEQPTASVQAVRGAFAAIESPIALAAAHVMTTLTGSVLLSLAHMHGFIDAQATWRAAHVDEIFQEDLWGQDEEAMKRRTLREQDFLAASTVYHQSA